MLTNTQKESVGVNFVLDRLICHSPYGIELARRIAPAAVEPSRCFDNIEKALALPPRDASELCGILVHFLNIRGIVDKCGSLTLTEVELFEMKGFLLVYERLMDFFRETKFALDGVCFPALTDALNILDPKQRRIAPFSIESDFSMELAEIRREKARVEDLIAKLGMTEELLKERADIAAREDSEEIRVMEILTGELRGHIAALCTAADSIGEMDLTLAKARLAKEYGAVRPKINQSAVMLVDMFNPYMEETLAKSGKRYKRVSIKLKKGATVITGANMGGKSAAIKTAVLNVLLCQMGFFVFAAEAEIPLFDDICLIAEEANSNFMSSFGSEIKRINEIVSRVKNEYLLIALDEPARGTNPAEGGAIVRALVEFLAESGSAAVIATHYDNVISPGVTHYQTAGLTPEAIERLKTGWSEAGMQDLIDYSLLEADASAPVPKDALNICRIIGLDEALLEKIVLCYTAEKTGTVSLSHAI